MTDKQKSILAAALELFANEGYSAVSTRMIAERAEVSEALIFRHFVHKKGLLDALYQHCEKKVEVIATNVLQEIDAAETIRKAIDWVFLIEEKDYDFWKLQFKLKWESAYHNPQKMKPVMDKITQAFQELGYERPALEAQLLEKTLDSIMIGILRDGKKAHLPLRQLLMEKYAL